MMNAAQAAAWFGARNDFLILTHKRPDGDTTGSAAGLCLALRKLKKTAYVAHNADFTPRLLPFAQPLLAPDGFVPAQYVSVDVAARELLTGSFAQENKRIGLAIDHHPGGGAYGEAFLRDENAAACGEIIYDLLAHLGVVPDQEIANALYVAVATDTGCFRFGNTTPRTLRCGAALLDAGADKDRINKDFFETKSKQRMAVESRLLSSLTYYEMGKLAVACLSCQTIREAGACEDDLENISSLVRQIEGVEVGVLLREEMDGGWKVSVRSSAQYRANEICAVLGGGGHHCAAGASLQGTLPEVRQRVLQAFATLYSS